MLVEIISLYFFKSELNLTSTMGICVKLYYAQNAILTFQKVCYNVKVKVLQGYIARII